MSKEAWGRWGAEDERGALNHIGPAQVRRASALVRSGQTVSLAQPLSPRTPVPKHRAGMQHFMGRDGGDYAAGARRPGGFQFAEDTVVLPLHIGTHIDALCHAWCEDCLYNGFRGQGTRSTSGALRCGIDKMPPIVTRGVLLDLVQLIGAPLGSIGRSDLVRAAEAAQVAIEPGDAVLIRTGWQEAQVGSADVCFDQEPGIDVEAASWLADAGAALVGADNFAIEAIPFPAGTVFPVHQRLIRDFGMPLLEGLVLQALAQHRRSQFLFVAAPLPVVGGTGSPLAPVAIL
ncbi:cyclase family protein [Rhodopila sp.]|uniref:cyclase family protein n=1 Tax=Rhodopila sp. TaxID=2480087 RepID=UPI003D118F5B